MNALGTGLVWCGVQVSLLALAGGLVYSLLRRRGPAAGSLVTLAILVIAIGLPVLALAPWPNWWRLQIPTVTGADRAAASGTTADASGAAPASESGAGRVSPASNSPKSGDVSFDAATWASTFWKNLWDGLGDRPAADSTARWRWPSVAACLLLVGMALGIARLSLGLAAVSGFRKRTKPVTDGALVALLEATRARLGCRHPIELRESAEIVSPATVGWRQPLILLPLEWRDWSAEERRVVLAHEVAHVLRADFAGWLVAQLSVALHFYNPLVHWLARRLRIEQELAADAWGAMAAGGSGTYLTTLAGMALRQDDRTVSWAARPFLPARGTFLRRIEMLRDKKQPQTFTFSTPKRIALWTVMAALGLFIAGVRGPGGTAIATADAAPPTGDTVGLLGATTQPIDLAYVQPDAALVVAVRPGDIMNSDAGKLIAKSDVAESMKIEQTLGLPLSDIEYAKFIMNDFPGSGPGRNPFSRIVVRATKTHDWTKFAATIVPDPVEVESTIAAAAGKKFFKPGKEPTIHSYGPSTKPGNGSTLHSYGPSAGAWCYYLPDDRTVIFGPEQEMPLAILASINPEPAPKWAKTWERAATGNLAVMLDVEKLRKLVELSVKEGRGGPDTAIVTMIGPLWQDSQRLIVGTDVSDKKLGLLALAECASDEAAGRVEHTSQALLTMAVNGLAAARKVEMGGPPDLVAIKITLTNAADELLKQARVTREGSTVVVQSQGAGATLLAAAGVALPAIAKTRAAAGRSQSMNNLKQLALAMHMYHAQHEHFPPAVVIGPDGKTPHSWRVELLPFVEQDALFQQYKMDEPWDSPANKNVLAQMPPTFRSPSDEPKGNDTDYFVLTGKNTLFSGKDGARAIDITGGTSNTIMIVEAKRNIPWTKPEDIDYDPAKPLPKLGGHFPGGFCAAFADGSVRFIADNVDEASLRAFFSPIDDPRKIKQLDPRRPERGTTPPATPATKP